MLPTTRSCRVPEGRGIDSAGIAPDVRIPLPLPEVLTDNVDTWTLWVAEDMKTKNEKNKWVSAPKSPFAKGRFSGNVNMKSASQMPLTQVRRISWLTLFPWGGERMKNFAEPAFK